MSSPWRATLAGPWDPCGAGSLGTPCPGSLPSCRRAGSALGREVPAGFFSEDPSGPTGRVVPSMGSSSEELLWGSSPREPREMFLGSSPSSSPRSSFRMLLPGAGLEGPSLKELPRANPLAGPLPPLRRVHAVLRPQGCTLGSLSGGPSGPSRRGVLLDGLLGAPRRALLVGLRSRACPVWAAPIAVSRGLSGELFPGPLQGPLF